MTDRELLEKSARSIGIWDAGFCLDADRHPIYQEGKGFLLSSGVEWWNPLMNPAQAFHLLVKHGFYVDIDNDRKRVDIGHDQFTPIREWADDRSLEEAVQRCIVRGSALLA